MTSEMPDINPEGLSPDFTVPNNAGKFGDTPEALPLPDGTFLLPPISAGQDRLFTGEEIAETGLDGLSLRFQAIREGLDTLGFFDDQESNTSGGRDGGIDLDELLFGSPGVEAAVDDTNARMRRHRVSTFMREPAVMAAMQLARTDEDIWTQVARNVSRRGTEEGGYRATYDVPGRNAVASLMGLRQAVPELYEQTMAMTAERRRLGSMETLAADNEKSGFSYVPILELGAGIAGQVGAGEVAAQHPEIADAVMQVDASPQMGGTFGAHGGLNIRINNRTRQQTDKDGKPGTESNLTDTRPGLITAADKGADAYITGDVVGETIRDNEVINGNPVCTDVRLIGWSADVVPAETMGIATPPYKAEVPGRITAVVEDRDGTRYVTRNEALIALSGLDTQPKIDSFDEASQERLQTQLDLPIDDPNKKAFTYAQYYQYIDRFKNEFPFKGKQNIGVIGSGDSGITAIGTALGYEPRGDNSSTTLDFVKKVEWFGQEATNDREFWEQARIGRYGYIGIELTRMANQERYSRIEPVNDKASSFIISGEGEDAACYINGRSTDLNLVIVATGPRVTAEERLQELEIRPISVFDESLVNLRSRFTQNELIPGTVIGLPQTGAGAEQLTIFRTYIDTANDQEMVTLKVDSDIGTALIDLPVTSDDEAVRDFASVIEEYQNIAIGPVEAEESAETAEFNTLSPNVLDRAQLKAATENGDTLLKALKNGPLLYIRSDGTLGLLSLTTGESGRTFVENKDYRFNAAAGEFEITNVFDNTPGGSATRVRESIEQFIRVGRGANIVGVENAILLAKALEAGDGLLNFAERISGEEARSLILSSSFSSKDNGSLFVFSDNGMGLDVAVTLDSSLTGATDARAVIGIGYDDGGVDVRRIAFDNDRAQLFESFNESTVLLIRPEAIARRFADELGLSVENVFGSDRVKNEQKLVSFEYDRIESLLTGPEVFDDGPVVIATNSSGGGLLVARRASGGRELYELLSYDYSVATGSFKVSNRQTERTFDEIKSLIDSELDTGGAVGAFLGANVITEVLFGTTLANENKGQISYETLSENIDRYAADGSIILLSEEPGSSRGERFTDLQAIFFEPGLDQNGKANFVFYQARYDLGGDYFARNKGLNVTDFLESANQPGTVISVVDGPLVRQEIARRNGEQLPAQPEVAAAPLRPVGQINNEQLRNLSDNDFLRTVTASTTIAIPYNAGQRNGGGPQVILGNNGISIERANVGRGSVRSRAGIAPDGSGTAEVNTTFIDLSSRGFFVDESEYILNIPQLFDSTIGQIEDVALSDYSEEFIRDTAARGGYFFEQNPSLATSNIPFAIPYIKDNGTVAFVYSAATEEGELKVSNLTNFQTGRLDSLGEFNALAYSFTKVKYPDVPTPSAVTAEQRRAAIDYLQFRTTDFSQLELDGKPVALQAEGKPIYVGGAAAKLPVDPEVVELVPDINENSVAAFLAVARNRRLLREVGGAVSQLPGVAEAAEHYARPVIDRRTVAVGGRTSPTVTFERSKTDTIIEPPTYTPGLDPSLMFKHSLLASGIELGLSTGAGRAEPADARVYVSIGKRGAQDRVNFNQQQPVGTRNIAIDTPDLVGLFSGLPLGWLERIAGPGSDNIVAVDLSIGQRGIIPTSITTEVIQPDGTPRPAQPGLTVQTKKGGRRDRDGIAVAGRGVRAAIEAARARQA